MQNGGQGATLAKPPPSRDGGVLADKEVVGGRQTNRRNVRGEFQRFVQPYECQIILVREEVVLGMDDLLGHSSLDVGQVLLHTGEVVLSYSYSNL